MSDGCNGATMFKPDACDVGLIFDQPWPYFLGLAGLPEVVEENRTRKSYFQAFSILLRHVVEETQGSASRPAADICSAIARTPCQPVCRAANTPSGSAAWAIEPDTTIAKMQGTRTKILLPRYKHAACLLAPPTDGEGTAGFRRCRAKEAAIERALKAARSNQRACTACIGATYARRARTRIHGDRHPGFSVRAGGSQSSSYAVVGKIGFESAGARQTIACSLRSTIHPACRCSGLFHWPATGSLSCVNHRRTWPSVRGHYCLPGRYPVPTGHSSDRRGWCHYWRFQSGATATSYRRHWMRRPFNLRS